MLITFSKKWGPAKCVSLRQLTVKVTVLLLLSGQRGQTVWLLIISSTLDHEGRWGTTYDFATSFLHLSLFSTALYDLANSRPVHSLNAVFPLLPRSALSSAPPPPLNVPCKMVLAKPDEQETRPYHCSLPLFTMVRRSLCGPIACWILARTSSLVTSLVTSL